jgi:hypothetical protein
MSIKRELRESFITFYKADIDFIRAEQSLYITKELTVKQIKLNEIEEYNSKLFKNNIFEDGSVIQFKFYPYFENHENIQLFKMKKNLTEEISNADNKTLLKNGIDSKGIQRGEILRENINSNNIVLMNMNNIKYENIIKSSNNLMEFAKMFKRSNIKEDIYTMTYNNSIILALNHLESICFPKKSICK